MDSKLRRLAILGSLAVILLVSLLVFYSNRDMQGGLARVKTDAVKVQTEESIESSEG